LAALFLFRVCKNLIFSKAQKQKQNHKECTEGRMDGNTMQNKSNNWLIIWKKLQVLNMGETTEGWAKNWH
jgi:hypothetical protein